MIDQEIDETGIKPHLQTTRVQPRRHGEVDFIQSATTVSCFLCWVFGHPEYPNYEPVHSIHHYRGYFVYMQP